MSNPVVDRASRKRSRTDEEVFVESSPLLDPRRLIRRLLALGWTYACLWCGIATWRGKSLTLHVDHINGVHSDNRLENLRFLCPNCHSQTDTFCNRTRPPGPNLC